MKPSSITLAVPHGVVFIYDPTMTNIAVPPDTGAGPILATSNCVSVWTLHEVDGETTITLTTAYDGDDCELVFRGVIETNGRRVAINDSSCEALLETQLSNSRPEIEIYANDPTTPTKLVCVVR
jgi:hypothetical protein